jgi:signal transduction histidine kinase/CheY-like chemotaxis protein
MPSSALEQRVLVVAPRGRDAAVIAEVLEADGIACAVLDGIDALLGNMAMGAATAIVADEALDAAAIARLDNYLAGQSSWSDFPLLLLVSRAIGPSAATERARLADLGNVLLLERPLNVQTLRSAVASALRGRRRQYQARDLLAERESASERLRSSQDQLVQLNETLEVRIGERTVALAQANDRLTKEIIERERALQAVTQLQKMEAIGRLTGGMAHDFNNLLNVVQGNMDLILMTSKDESAKRRAEVARNACRRGAKLTSQLLAFSRNQSLDLRPVPVAALFAGIRELVATSVGSTITLYFDIDPDVDSVLADANQMEMALLNLAINARDAMPSGGTLRFQAAHATPPPSLPVNDDYICIGVTDSGSGMSPEIAAKVFEPFFTTKGVDKGTGLGLSQVYGMAQQSGGAALIRSQEHAGTTVEIWLRSATSPTGADVQPGGRVASAQRTARILVVEDDPFVRTSVVESLQALGHHVTQAGSATGALQELAREQPDLMITDYMMPGMTGVELMVQARVLYPQLPMIIATGYADMKAIEEALGDDILLRKPFQLADLSTSVRRALARGEAMAQQAGS